MITIPLTRGQVAYIDDGDAALLAGWRWCAIRPNGIWYAKGSRGRESVLMHRLVLGLPAWRPGTLEVDHIDGSGLNNTRANLRAATRAQNSANMRKTRGVSRYKGVLRCRDRWAAKITVKRRTQRLGCFDDEVFAAAAYDRAVRKYFGAYARVNFRRPTDAGEATG